MRASSRARREARPRCYRREESLAPRPCLIEHRPRRDRARAPLLAKGSEARARRVRRRYARVGRRSEPRAYRGNLSAAALPRARAEGPHAGPKVFQRSSAPALALSGARDAPFVRIHGRDARRRRRRTSGRQRLPFVISRRSVARAVTLCRSPAPALSPERERGGGAAVRACSDARPG